MIFIGFSGLHDFTVGAASTDLATLNEVEPAKYSLCAHYTGTVAPGDTITVVCDQPVTGQFIFIQIPAPNELLGICEVEIYSGK